MIHRLIIPFPLGLLATSFFFDIAWVLYGRDELAIVSFWMILAGVVTALLAAAFGVADFRRIAPETPAKRIGKMHGIGSVIVAFLFAASWVVRRDEPAAPELLAIAFSATGVALAIVTGWLGGRLAGGEDNTVGPANAPVPDRREAGR